MAKFQRTAQQWQAIIEQHALSGLQVTAFCKQQKLTPSNFYTWRKRLASQAASPSNNSNNSVTHDVHQDDWLGIMPEPSAATQPWDIELALPNGVVLRMMNH